MSGPASAGPTSASTVPAGTVPASTVPASTVSASTVSAAQSLSGERVLVCDGAMGTMLHAAGAALDRSLPELNLSDPGLVATIHDSYLIAGADIIQANTFGANRLWLGDHGFPDKVEEINQAGVRLAREAAGRGGRPVLVAGSVSPAVTARQRRGVGSAERTVVLREQIAALVAAGTDLLILETFGYLDELVEAVGVAAACPVWFSWSVAVITAVISVPTSEELSV